MNEYKANWYALFLAIVKYKDGDEALRLMGLIPHTQSENIEVKINESV